MPTLTQNISIEKTTKSRLQEQDINNSPFGKVFSDHMLVASYSEGSWKEVKIIPYGKLEMSPSISALHYGQTIFEGLKAYKNAAGEPLLFRPDANWQRLNKSAERMCMPPIPQEVFMDGLKELIKLDADWIPNQEGSVLYIRPMYFATDEAIGVKPASNYKFIIITCPVGAYFSNPVKLLVTEKYVRSFEGGTGEAKTAGNYAGSLLADKEAKAAGYDNILWLDGKEKKYIEECSTMNVAFVIDDAVITPKLTGTILPGITRDSILTLLKDRGVKVEERLISIEEIVAAYEEGKLTEAFGMGTAATKAHIHSINYRGKDMVFPPIEERKYGPQIYEKLEAIKYGKIADPYGWVCQIQG
jgi:branched-chain amino acid aminotransferase